MATDGDRIKGTCIKSVLGFLAQERLLDATLAGFPPERRETFAASVLATGWYPADAYIDLLDAVASRVGPDSELLMLRVGKQIVADGLSTVYRTFLSVSSPAQAVARCGFLWRSYFQRSQIEIVRTEAGVAEFEVRGEPRTSPAYCLTKLGGMIGSLEIVGARNVHGEHPRCRCRGDDACRFRLSWEG